MVEVTIGRGGELERSEADIVESLVINAESLIRVLDKLVNGEGSVVRLKNTASQLLCLPRQWRRPSAHLNDGVRDLG